MATYLDNSFKNNKVIFFIICFYKIYKIKNKLIKKRIRQEGQRNLEIINITYL